MRGLRTRRLRGSSLQRLTSDAPDFYRHNGDELRREKKKVVTVRFSHNCFFKKKVHCDEVLTNTMVEAAEQKMYSRKLSLLREKQEDFSQMDSCVSIRDTRHE